MGLAKRVLKTAGWFAYDNAEQIVNICILPKVSTFVAGKIANRFGKPISKWLTAKVLSNKAVDGAIRQGFNMFTNSGSKFALRKGLPSEINGERTLAIENEPHVLDGFDGVIASGYGKGTKRIVYKGKAVVKIRGKSSVTDIEYHVHQADKAGLHYDLAVKDLPSKEDIFELNIGRGLVKGRYAFVRTDRGYIVTQMKDRGLSIPKPTYNLKHEDFLEKISNDSDLRSRYIIERKLDGSLANVLIYEDRAIMHSHRESPRSYYDKLPSLEFLKNNSKYFLSRTFFPSPKLDGTVLKVELVHKDGASVVSGILNSSADNAVLVQRKIGNVIPYAWDIVKLNGKDISSLPYSERRLILERTINQIRIFNPNWRVIEICPEKSSPLEFYHSVINDSKGLPFSEGVVIKLKTSIMEDSWLKVKMFDLIDMEILSFIEGNGKYEGSLGSIVARDLETGNVAIVGTGLSDFERAWIWEHREMLSGAVIKTRVFEETDESFRAPRFIEFHESKGNNEHGLLLYSDVLAGLDDKDKMLSIKHALINAA